MLTWVTKKGKVCGIYLEWLGHNLLVSPVNSVHKPSPKAYGFYKVTASKFTNLKD